MSRSGWDSPSSTQYQSLHFCKRFCQISGFSIVNTFFSNAVTILNIGLVWYSNGRFVSVCQIWMVVWKRPVYVSKCPVFEWSAKSHDFTIWIPDTHRVWYSDFIPVFVQSITLIHKKLPKFKMFEKLVKFSPAQKVTNEYQLYFLVNSLKTLLKLISHPWKSFVIVSFFVRISKLVNFHISVALFG